MPNQDYLYKKAILSTILLEARHYLRMLVESQVDISSFLEHETLCPYIFHDNLKMRSDIAESLMGVAKDFYGFLGFDWMGEDGLFDVQMVGSLAGYNWSEMFSDLDLHLVIDFSRVSRNSELVEGDVWAKKTLYNQEHDISIKGFSVELYVQDVNDKIESNGIFSVMRQTWIRKPVRKKPQIDKAKVKSLVSEIESKIKEAIAQYREGNFDTAKEMADSIMESLREMRKKGLSSTGEFSPENIAYKVLRRNSMLDKVKTISTKSFDRESSIDRSPSEKIDVAKKERQKKAKREAKHRQSQSKKQQPDGYSDGIQYSIMGKSFSSLRDAEKQLGIPHSTLNYRVNSDSPQYGAYKKLTSQK